MEVSDVLDQTKENIQPLRRGRRTDHLGTVLQAQISNSEAQLELQQQREQFELAIRMYEGDDPLMLRYDFAHWIEQSYPSLGPECKLLDLLEDTINIYKNWDQYKQDRRFVEILVKYINAQLNPLELYQLVYNQGLGTMCAILYISWAEELEQNQDWKHANQVYQLGINNRVEPVEELKNKQEQFQLSVGRLMCTGNDMTNNSLAEEESSLSVQAPPRKALSKIHKSSVIGTRIPKGNPGVLRPSPSMVLALNNNKQRKPISIFQEDEDENLASSGSEMKFQMNKIPNSIVINKENSLKAGTWRNKNTSSSGASSTSTSYLNHRFPNRHSSSASSRAVSSTSAFEVHMDEDLDESPPVQTPVVPRALKTIKTETATCPVAIFGMSDSSIQVVYPKNKVYVGGREFQLEELKAAHYFKQHNLLNQVIGDMKYCMQTPLTCNKKENVATSIQETPMSFNTKSTQLSTSPNELDRHKEGITEQGLTTRTQKSMPVRLFMEDENYDNDINDQNGCGEVNNVYHDKKIKLNGTNNRDENSCDFEVKSGDDILKEQISDSATNDNPSGFSVYSDK